jgi:hypothetical protein
MVFYSASKLHGATAGMEACSQRRIAARSQAAAGNWPSRQLLTLRFLVTVCRAALANFQL